MFSNKCWRWLLFVLNADVSIKKSIKQKGYTTVLTLILFSALGLALLSVFNSGQIVTHKLKLQNAVDAAAYSSLTVAARDMNYKAYTNRAMVVNQVAIGQMVGIYSWTMMMKQASSNVDKLAAPLSAIPGIGALLKMYFQGFEFAGKASHLSARALRPVIIASRLVNYSLASSQVIVDLMTKASMLQMYPKVLKDNDPDAVMGALGTAEYGKYITAMYKPGSEYTKKTKAPSAFNSSNLARYDKFADVIKESTDSFTKKRSYRWVKFPSLLIFKARIDKNGGNEFNRRLKGGRYVWDWSAMDTVSLWTETWSLKHGWRERETIPLGGGAADTSKKGGRYPYSGSNSKWGGAKKNYLASLMARSNQKNIGQVSLERFYFLNDTKKNPIPPEFIAIASKEAGGVRTWGKVIKDSGGQVGKSFDIEKEGNLRSSKMYSMAKAQVYYSRSHDLDTFKREDGLFENGNSLNPYWQVRLIDLTPKEKAIILGLIPR